MGPLSQQHGFARNLEWSLLGEEEAEGPGAEAGGAALELQLCNSEATFATGWPYAFCLRLRVALSASGELSMRLRATNRGASPFSFTAALHTYFAVQDVNGLVNGSGQRSWATVRGLAGSDYLDSLQGRKRCTETHPQVGFAAETDRIYLGVLSKEVQVCQWSEPSPSAAGENAPVRSVRIRASGGLRDAVVWNPWVAKSKAMADFGDDEFRRMVCVEAAAVTPQALGPGESWEGEQRLSVA